MIWRQKDQQVLLYKVDYWAVDFAGRGGLDRLSNPFRSPITVVPDMVTPLNSLCQHERQVVARRYGLHGNAGWKNHHRWNFPGPILWRGCLRGNIWFHSVLNRRFYKVREWRNPATAGPGGRSYVLFPNRLKSNCSGSLRVPKIVNLGGPSIRRQVATTPSRH